MKKKFTFIGAGNMAEALINGFIRSKLVSQYNITASDIKKQRLSYLKRKYGIRIENDNSKALKGADIIFLAVKPQTVKNVLNDISSFVSSKQLVISIAAGIKTEFIESYLPKGTAVIRCMPNTPAIIGEGACAICKGAYAKGAQLKLADSLFSTVGVVAQISENEINSVTALSGSGPAYVFYLAEAMEKAGKAMGLKGKTASILARQTVFGAAKLLKEGNSDPEDLRLKVTSPGGTTEAAINYFQSRGFIKTVQEGIRKAEKKAEELSSPR